MARDSSQRKTPIGAVACGIIGALGIIFGIVLAVKRYPQQFVDHEFREHITIDMDNSVYDQWVNPPTPIYMKYYIFNVTNGPDLVAGKKAIVNEMGPYTYRMLVPRFDISFYTNSSVAYRFNHTLIFEPDKSSGKEDDIIHHVNMPLVTIAAMMENIGGKQTKLFAKLVELIGERDLVILHTAKEILFGYKDPFFEMLNDILEVFGLHYDPMFAPFYGFNNSDDGLYLSTTGKANYSMTNKLQRWNGNKLLPYWSTDYANMINGTDGTFFRPYLKKSDERYLFFSDMCRSLKLTYEKEVVVKGVMTYRFHFADDLLANKTIQPDNAGFCVPPDNCYDSGVVTATPCKSGAPVLLSLPHFYNAADIYQNGVEGLHPNKTLHDSVFDVEPTSGAVFFSSRSVQINIEVKPSQYLEQMKQVKNFVCPAMWLAGVATMDDAISAELRTAIRLEKFMNVVSYVIIAIFVLILAASIFYAVKKRRKNSTDGAEESRLITE